MRQDLGVGQQDRALLERALRAIAVGRARGARLEAAALRLAEAQAEYNQLREEQHALWNELESAVDALARHEHAAGLTPEHMVVLLKDIVESSELAVDLRRSVEPEVVSRGIAAYFAA